MVAFGDGTVADERAAADSAGFVVVESVVIDRIKLNLELGTAGELNVCALARDLARRQHPIVRILVGF